MENPSNPNGQYKGSPSAGSRKFQTTSQLHQVARGAKGTRADDAIAKANIAAKPAKSRGIK